MGSSDLIGGAFLVLIIHSALNNCAGYAQLFKALCITVVWTAAALNFSAGVGLVKRRDPVAVRRAITILWVAGPLADVLREFVVPLLAAVHTLKPDSSFIWSTIAAGAWTAYLYRSKRVRVTYGTVTR